MKNRIKLIFSFALFTMISLGAFAQNYNSNYSYEYNDDIYIDDHYDNRGNDYRGGDYYDDRGRNYNYNVNNRRYRTNNRRSIRSQRARKAAILDRAYARAYRDGRISRRESRELRALENRLGIWRRNSRGNRICY